MFSVPDLAYVSEIFAKHENTIDVRNEYNANYDLHQVSYLKHVNSISI